MICPCALLLFVSLFATLVGASKIIPIGDSLANSCHFAVEDQKFDLCPVLEGKENGWTVEFEKRTPPTVTRTQYKISLHGSLEKDQSLPDDEQVIASRMASQE